MKKIILCFILSLTLFNCEKDDEIDTIRTETTVCADNDLAKKVVVKAILKDCLGNNLVNSRAVFYRKRGGVSLSDEYNQYKEFQSVEINNSQLDSQFVFIDDFDLEGKLASYFIQFRDNLTRKVSNPIEISVKSGEVNLSTIFVCNDPDNRFGVNDVGGHYLSDVFLTKQSEIDAFGKLGHGEILGALYIGEEGKERCNDITNLKYLQYINLCRSLEIVSNPSLISLEGLENLKKDIGSFNTRVQNVIIEDNPSLENLIGLNLEDIEELEIINNASLTSLQGLEGLTEIKYGLVIKDNSSLTSFSGLENLAKVGLDSSAKIGLWIENNSSLLNLNGLDSFIYGRVCVKSNPKLTSLNGLDRFKLSDDLRIEDNPVLTNISSLKSLNRAYFRVRIVNNTNLKDLDGLNNVEWVEYGCDSFGCGFRESTILLVRDCENLVDYCALNIDYSDSEFYERLDFRIESNKYNPTVKNLIDGNCSQ